MNRAQKQHRFKTHLERDRQLRADEVAAIREELGASDDEPTRFSRFFDWDAGSVVVTPPSGGDA